MPMLLKRRSEKKGNITKATDGPGKKHRPMVGTCWLLPIVRQSDNQLSAISSSHSSATKPIVCAMYIQPGLPFGTQSSPPRVSRRFASLDPHRIRRIKVAAREWQSSRVNQVKERVSFAFMSTTLKQRSRAHSWLLHLVLGRQICHSDTSCHYQSTSFQCSYLVQVYNRAQSTIISAVSHSVTQ
ncbi:hypothetical protein CGRA01v4_13614 [Colletotrichum graminicola]|nr:hypothetical protein CGRA01v4_13614 [Colletotrichum graminicola]